MFYKIDVFIKSDKPIDSKIIEEALNEAISRILRTDVKVLYRINAYAVK